MTAPDARRPDLRVTLAGVSLEHPVLNASGTFDALETARRYGAAALTPFPFAAYVPKTVTLEARAGNPPPRLTETASGMINAVGLQNPGIAAWLDELPAPGRHRRTASGQHRRQPAERLPRGAAPGRGASRRRGGRASAGGRLRVERVVSERGEGRTGDRNRAGRDGAAHRRRARPHQAARHRQAHPQRHRHRGRGEGGRRRRRRRRVAREHAARAGARSPESHAVSGESHGRAVAGRPSSPSPCAWCGRWRASSRCRSSAWAASRPASDALEFIACGATAVAVGIGELHRARGGAAHRRRAGHRDEQSRAGRSRRATGPRTGPLLAGW